MTSLTGQGPAAATARPGGPPVQPLPRNRSQRQVDESAEIKTRILKAASEVFAEKGFVQATLADVATRVGLTRPGLLHHFNSKDALLSAVLANSGKWAEAVVATEPGLGYLRAFVTPGESGQQRLRLVHVLEGEALIGNDNAKAFANDRLLHVRREIAERLTELRATGAVDPTADLEAQTVLVTAVVNGLQKLTLLQPDTAAAAAFDLLLELLVVTTPDPGRAT